MKKHIGSILIGLLIVLQFLSFSRIGTLQDELTNTRNQMEHMASDQTNQMNNIYSNIDSLLKRQASIIDSFDYSFGNVDSEKLTVPITFEITPKETKTGTSATLKIFDQSAVMNRNGTTFTATISTDIFKPFEATVVLADSGVERTEKLEVPEDLQSNILPVVRAILESVSESTIYQLNPGELNGEYQRKGNVILEVKPVKNNRIEQARLVYDIDGKIVYEKDIDTDAGLTEMNKKITVAAGETLTVSVLATDSFGLIHKSIVDVLTLNKKAEPVHENDWMWLGQTTIIDKNGKVLYTPN